MFQFFFRLTIIAVFSFFLSCSEKNENSKKVKPDIKNEVILYNWKEYTSLDVLKKFEQETGIKVVLKEFETIEEQIGTLQSNPYFCDLTIVDTHVATSQFYNTRLIQNLDFTLLENTKHFESHFKEFTSFSVPYSFGITGYAIDTRKVKKEYSDYSFLTDPAYKGKLALLDDPYDCFLSLMVATGNDINGQITPDILSQLESTCVKLKENQISFNETFTNLDKLVEGEKWIVQTYSGDAASYQQENDFIKFFFNSEKYNAWSESICLISNAPNKENAYKLLNFLTRPENAAAFSNEFYYANGIIGSEKFMSETIRSNPLINISSDVRKRGIFYLKSKDSNAVMQKIFSMLGMPSEKDQDEEKN